MKLDLITEDEAARKSEYRKRKSPYLEETIKASDLAEYEKDGWSPVRENKSGTVRARKRKPIDQILEDDFWCILFQLGYKTLNIGRDFKIPLSKEADGPYKKVSIFAHDDTSIVIAECEASKNRVQKHLATAIYDLANLRKPISDALRQHFGGVMKQRLIWAFATRNINWSENDLKRASDNNIHVIRDTEIAYFYEISRRIGAAARFQFQAEFLKSSKALEDVKVFALRTTLAGETAYSFFAPAHKILPLSFVNHRDLRDPEASPSYQRMVQKNRLTKIGEYLKNGGFFPNTIVVNFHEKVVFDFLKPTGDDGIAVGTLTLPKNYKSIMIIDGQHRLYGYTQLESHDAPDLQFLAFEGIAILKETKLFSDINYEQKTVSPKLLDEIAGEIKLDSTNPVEQMRAISSRCFDLMRSDQSGPFGAKISGADMVGSGSGDLHLPSLNNAIKDARLLGYARKKEGKFDFFAGPISWDDPKTAIDKLYRLLTAYFNLFRDASPDRWEAGKQGVFGRNIGVAGLTMVLRDAIEYYEAQSGEDPRAKEPEDVIDEVARIIAPLLDYFRDAETEDLQQRFRTQFGTAGPKEFHRKARFLLHDANKDFLPPGLEQQLKEFSKARTEVGDKLTRLIQERVLTEVTDRLKMHYGDSNDFLVDAGLPTADFGALSERQQEHRKKFGEKLPLETFVDFIKWKQVVQKPENWPLVEEVVSFNLENKGNPNRKELTSWFDDMNSIRRIPAHPFGRESYSDHEMEVLVFLYSELKSRGVLEEEVSLDAVS